MLRDKIIHCFQQWCEPLLSRAHTTPVGAFAARKGHVTGRGGVPVLRGLLRTYLATA